VPLRAAGVCGLLALVTSTLGWLVGGLAQSDAYSSADDDVSDLGALTASSAWVYNQIGANLTGVFVMVLALGVWRALSPDLLGRIGAGALFLVGLGVFLDGFLRLDCQGIDRGCMNDSWHSDAHKMESRFTVAAFFLTPVVLAFAFRRNPGWREAWLPSLLEIPAGIAVGVAFSAFGDGAAVRATTFVWFLWAAYLGVLLIRKAEGGRVGTEV
jgi:Protein of unknown function (DUF998)